MDGCTPLMLVHSLSKSSSNWEWPSSFWTRWSMENPMPFKICRKPLNSTTGILWQWLELREEWVCWARSSFPGPWKWHRNEAARTCIFWPPASILKEFFQNLGKIKRISSVFLGSISSQIRWVVSWFRRQKPFLQGHGGWTNEGANNPRFIRVVVKIDSWTVTSLKQPQLFVERDSRTAAAVCLMLCPLFFSPKNSDLDLRPQLACLF